MKGQLLGYLCCPTCAGELVLHTVSEEYGAEIERGELICSGCQAQHPIFNGIPRLLSQSKALTRHDQHTMKFFGYEWTVYRNWGWVPEGFERTGWDTWGSLSRDAEAAFIAKSQLDDQDLVGKVILDAGCGNGRYAFQAAKRAQTVIAFDLSRAVDAARENTKSCLNIHVVQADILHPPFKASSFDTVFSIGVLGFASDAQAAFESLVKLAKPQGVIAVQFSHKGNAVFELVDNTIRRFSSRFSVLQLMWFATVMAALGNTAHALRIARYVNLAVRLQPTRHHMFDWYSASRIDRRSYEEVFGWFDRHGLEIVAHQQRSSSPRWVRAIAPPWALAVKGRKPTP